MDIFSKIKKI